MEAPKLKKSISNDNDCIAIGVLFPHMTAAGGDRGDRLANAWGILQELKALGWECQSGNYPQN